MQVQDGDHTVTHIPKLQDSNKSIFHYVGEDLKFVLYLLTLKYSINITAPNFSRFILLSLPNCPLQSLPLIHTQFWTPSIWWFQTWLTNNPLLRTLCRKSHSHYGPFLTCKMRTVSTVIQMRPFLFSFVQFVAFSTPHIKKVLLPCNQVLHDVEMRE